MQVDPGHQQRVRQCRDALLPVFVKMRSDLDAVMGSMGMERAEPDIDVLGVQGPDERLAAAVAGGQVLDLCDDDDDNDDTGSEENSDGIEIRTLCVVKRASANVPLGAEIRTESECVVVLSVVQGGAAATAWIRAGDRLIKVNGIAVTDATDVASCIRKGGSSGSHEVTCLIMRTLKP